MTEWVKIKRGLFYKPDNCGYTGIRDHAGRYSEDEAKAEARLEGVTAMPLSEAPEFSAACFDDLARAHLQRQRDMLLEYVASSASAGCVTAKHLISQLSK